jgi:hypothetical protein
VLGRREYQYKKESYVQESPDAAAVNLSSSFRTPSRIPQQVNERLELPKEHFIVTVLISGKHQRHTKDRLWTFLRSLKDQRLSPNSEYTYTPKIFTGKKERGTLLYSLFSDQG